MGWGGVGWGGVGWGGVGWGGTTGGGNARCISVVNTGEASESQSGQNAAVALLKSVQHLLVH